MRMGADQLSIFGSYARAERRAGSDVDVVVRLWPGFGYFDLGEIKALLEADLGVEVNPIIEARFGHEDRIRGEFVPVY
jgi:predicted nucleotidyltransferase